MRDQEAMIRTKRVQTPAATRLVVKAAALMQAGARYP